MVMNFCKQTDQHKEIMLQLNPIMDKKRQSQVDKNLNCVAKLLIDKAMIN